MLHYKQGKETNFGDTFKFTLTYMGSVRMTESEASHTQILSINYRCV